MSALSADVAQLLRELPARMASLEQKVSAGVQSAEAKVTPSDVEDFITDVQTKINSWAANTAKHLAELQALNLPGRLALAEVKIAQLTAKLSAPASAPAVPATHGTLAQQTPAPAAPPVAAK